MGLTLCLTPVLYLSGDWAGKLGQGCWVIFILGWVVFICWVLIFGLVIIVGSVWFVNYYKDQKCNLCKVKGPEM